MLHWSKPVPKTRAEIEEAAEYLESDYRAGGLIKKNREYAEIYQLREAPNLSDELSRGRTVTNPSVRLGEWVGNVINQVLPYSTFPLATAIGTGLTPTEVDKLQAMVALMLAEANTGQALIRRAYRGFLRRSHVVYQNVPGNMDDPMPFKINLPLIDTVFFERFDGGRPAMASRRYKVLVKDAEKRYSNRKGETDLSGKAVTWDGKMMRVSGEIPAVGTRQPMSQGNTTRLLEVREFYDDEYCSHLVRGDNMSGDWQEVYRYKTPYGGTPFFVVPSWPQEDELWEEDWRPIGWPGFSRVKQINRIEAIRATRAEHVQEHIIARLPPDQQEAVDKLMKGGYAPVLHGGVNFMPMAADEIVQWTQIPDADLVERAREHEEKLERWIASWLLPSSAEVVRDANVGTYQLGAKAVHAQESGLLSCHTQGMAAMAEMMLCAMADKYAADRQMYASDTTAYGRMGASKVEPGNAITVSAETLKKVKIYGPDANLRVEVVTRSETESELEQREAAVWNNVQRGSQTFDEFIAVRNPDVAGQHEALTKDGVRRSLAAVYDKAIPQIAAKRNLERYGVDVDRLMQQNVMQQPMPPQQAGGSNVMVQGVPPTEGADVSSAGGTMMAGAAG